MNLLRKSFLCAVGVSTTILGTHAIATSSNYQIDFNPPRHMQWRLVHDQQDSRGYTQKYTIQNGNQIYLQNIVINYKKGTATSLRNAMQEALDIINLTGCQIKNNKIIKEQKNSLVFSITMRQCPNGRAAKEVIKVFNKQDGQYSIIYGADTYAVSAKEIRQMEAAVTAAKIVGP